MPPLSKQIETGPKSFFVSVRCVCVHRPCSGFQPNVHYVGDASLATYDLDRKLGLISGDFMKNTEMSPATKSNCELQPESERRLHQFQDSLLPSA